MSEQIPQYADYRITFSNISNSLDPTPVDLTALSDIILSLTNNTPLQTPLVILKNSVDSSRFAIDNIAKSVTVTILASDFGGKNGKFYTNLWLVANGKHTTHLVSSFDIKPTVNYQ